MYLDTLFILGKLCMIISCRIRRYRLDTEYYIQTKTEDAADVLFLPFVVLKLNNTYKMLLITFPKNMEVFI